MTIAILTQGEPELNRLVYTIAKSSTQLGVSILILVDEDKHSVALDFNISIMRTLYPQIRVEYRSMNKNFGEQRNYAISRVENDWLLFLDSDEMIKPDFIPQLIWLLPKLDTKKVYYFKRHNIIWNKEPIPIDFNFVFKDNDTNTDNQGRLLHTSSGYRYIGEIHEGLVNWKGEKFPSEVLSDPVFTILHNKSYQRLSCNEYSTWRK